MNLYELNENWRPEIGEAMEAVLIASALTDIDMELLLRDDPKKAIVIAGAITALRSLDPPDRVSEVILTPTLIRIYNTLTRIVESIGERHGIDHYTADNRHVFADEEKEIIAIRLGYVKMCVDFELIPREKFGKIADKAEKITMLAVTERLKQIGDEQYN